ncbi:MAG: outer membrane beta-barrel protein [Candidatus Omnitrophota bacterium]|nr:outer membrane beta-barrel protein [Candidatus Omnitrophota bacterium]
MKRVYPIFVFVFFTSLLCVESLFALSGYMYDNKYPYEYYEEDVKPEKARISPWGEIKLTYDDNLFLDKDDKKSDVLITLTPGVTAYLPFSDNLLTLDYHVDFNRYMDYSNQDATNHFLYGNLELNWRDVTFNIYDKFSNSYERPSTEDTSRVRKYDNRAGITANAQKDRLGIQLGFENFTRDYKSTAAYDLYDRTERIYSAMLTHQTFEKTKLLAEYDFGQIRYDSNAIRSDSDFHQFLVGAIGDLTPKTTATIKVGVQARNYENSSTPDFSSGVVYADLTHEFSEKDALKLSFLRTANESTYQTNNYYTLNDIHGTYDHFFTPKLLGFLTGLYQDHSYPNESTEGGVTKKRQDNYYSMGAGMKYYIRKWFTVTFQAEHIWRDSNFSNYNYQDNLITISAKAVL